MSSTDLQSTIVTYGSGRVTLNLIVGVHGDERAPIKAAKMLEKYIQKYGAQKSFRLIYANTPAIKKNKRKIDIDLNRCFPGKKKGLTEEKVAHNLLPYLQNTFHNYDFHSTTFKIKPYGIISAYSKHVKKAIRYIGVDNYIVIDLRCLIRFAQNGLAFEMGKDTDEKTVHDTLRLMKRILNYHMVLLSKKKKKSSKANLFQIYGALNKRDYRSLRKCIQDFKRIKEGEVIGISSSGEIVRSQIDFYPMWRDHPDLVNIARKIEIKD